MWVLPPPGLGGRPARNSQSIVGRSFAGHPLIPSGRRSDDGVVPPIILRGCQHPDADAGDAVLRGAVPRATPLYRTDPRIRVPPAWDARGGRRRLRLLGATAP